MPTVFLESRSAAAGRGSPCASAAAPLRDSHWLRRSAAPQAARPPAAARCVRCSPRAQNARRPPSRVGRCSHGSSARRCDVLRYRLVDALARGGFPVYSFRASCPQTAGNLRVRPDQTESNQIRPDPNFGKPPNTHESRERKGCRRRQADDCRGGKFQPNPTESNQIKRSVT
jgi:hypothetical protein